MKSLVLMLAVLVGCTGSVNTQAKPNKPHPTPTPSATVSPEPTSEPEEVDTYEVPSGGLSWVTCADREFTECGITFYNCSNDLIYGCMVNIVYKVKTEKR